jgi:hypothetical protein
MNLLTQINLQLIPHPLNQHFLAQAELTRLDEEEKLVSKGAKYVYRKIGENFEEERPAKGKDPNYWGDLIVSLFAFGSGALVENQIKQALEQQRAYWKQFLLW